jgi:hypothetical protein
MELKGQLHALADFIHEERTSNDHQARECVGPRNFLDVGREKFQMLLP